MDCYCGKPMFVTVAFPNGPKQPLCTEHYMQMQAVENEKARHQNDQVRNGMAMMNLAASDMDAVAPWAPTPRVAVPQPSAAGQYTNVHVQDSVVGVVNTAAVGQISSYIGALPSEDKVRKAIEQFTTVVANEVSMPDEKKRELLDQVTVIAEQAATDPLKQKKGLIVPLLAAINQGAQTLSAVANAWQAVSPIIRSHFGF